MKTKIFSIISLSFCWFLLFSPFLGLEAAPVPEGVRKIVKQANGQTLEIRLSGDEHLHYWSTTDGIPVLQWADNQWYYIESMEGNRFHTSGVLAKEASLRTDREQKEAEKFLAQTLRDRTQASLSPAPRHAKAPTSGNLRGLVIMAEFADRTFTPACTQEQMDRQLNEAGYQDFGMTGSARDYFIDQSHGCFQPVFDVVGPVRLSHETAYYGNDSLGSNILGSYIIQTDLRIGDFAEESCRLAKEHFQVDFSRYDNNGDGEADLVFIIFAGYAESNGAGTQNLWPQMNYLADSLDIELHLDGVKINRFACSNELSGFSGSDIAGIGTFCHEFSHTLGLMDLYGSGMLDMGTWSLMANGCYNNEGKTPSSLSSFEKMLLGWCEPDTVETAARLALPPFETSNQAYLVPSDNNANEYLLLENRQRNGKWDAALGGEGMLLIHVDYDEKAWGSNQVNTDPAHRRLYLIPANKDSSSSSDPASTPFPGSLGVANFSPLTHPSAVWHSGQEMSRTLTNIHPSADSILFDFMQNLPAPVALEASNISRNSFTANREAVETATRYTVRLFHPSSGEERTIRNVEQTRYTFGGLETGSEYLYKVQASNDILVSDFSNEIKVGIPSGNEIPETTKVHAYSQHGILYVESPVEVRIYDLLGRERAQLGPEAARKGVSLPSGIYLVCSLDHILKIGI